MNWTFMKSLLVCLIGLLSYTNLFSGQDSLFFATSLEIAEAQKKNYRYLGDILFTMPGFWVRDIGSTGQWASSRIGGSLENQSLILLDGRPLREPWSGISDLNWIPVEMIDKVEIYPSINPFGLTSVGGIVNLISKDIPSTRPYTKIVYRSGTDNFSDLDVTFGQKITSRWKIISGVLFKKYGESLPDKKYKSQQIRSTMVYSLSSDLELRYTILHNKSDLDLPYSIPMPGDSLILTSPHRERSRYDHTFSTKWNLWGTKNVFRIEHTSVAHEIRETNVHPTRRFPALSTTIFFKQRFRLRKIPFSWGIHTRRRQLKDDKDLSYNDTIVHGFFHGEFLFLGRLRDIFQFNTHVSTDGKPKILLSNQLSWALNPQMEIWTGYSEAVRDPTLGERFGFPFYPTVSGTENQLFFRSHSNDLLPNKDLKPESARMFEAGIRWQWRNGQAYFRGFLKSADNLIEGAVTQEGMQFSNQNKGFFNGLETQCHLGPWYGFKGSVTLNLLEAKDGDKHNLLERPNSWGNGSLSWEQSFFQTDLNVHLCLTTRYWTGFWKLAGDNLEQSYLQYENEGFTLDFKAFFTVIKNATISFAIDNILGKEFGFVSTFLMPQQTTRIGFSWVLFD